MQRHHAFSIDYPHRVREICTSIGVSTPTLSQPFDPDKYVANFSKAIWDTGATGTVITKQVIESLKLQPTGMTNVIGVHGAGTAPTYVVDIILPNKVIVTNLNVIGGKEGSVDVLIGMDIIQLGDFVISNANGKTKFSFCLPSHQNPICLVEKSNRVNEKIEKEHRRQLRRHSSR